VNVVPPGDGEESSPGGKLSPNTVLIAEDDPIFRRILESWLEKWNYHVTALENGAEAWYALQQDDSPQLVILDWIMPGLDGIEVCRRIRTQQKGANIYLAHCPICGAMACRDRAGAISPPCSRRRYSCGKGTWI
jgi:CheY-like chemotaxis protein